MRFVHHYHSICECFTVCSIGQSSSHNYYFDHMRCAQQSHVELVGKAVVS